PAGNAERPPWRYPRRNARRGSCTVRPVRNNMDSGNLAWVIIATALVLLMTPGVAFFYGGLVKAKSVVSMMMMSFGALGIVTVLWVLFGYSMISVDAPWSFAGNPFADFGLTATIADD